MAKAPEDDYYVLLGIDAAADDDEVRRAWRRLALEWHPDRAGPGATTTFQNISVAYAVLSDPDARAAYDRWRDRATASSRAASSRNAAQVGPRAPSVMLRRLSGHMNSLLARGIAHYAEGDMIELLLDDEEASQGGMVTISMRVLVRCPACGSAEAARSCATCGGARSVEDLFAAWLAIRPGVAEGTILTPSAWLPGMLRPVYFRVRLPGERGSVGTS